MDLSLALAFCEHLVVTLAAGVIVGLFERGMKNRRANEDVQKQFDRVIASLKPSQIPRIEAIINSAAAEHHVRLEKFNPISLFANNAISRIMDNPFIDDERREKYCAFAERIEHEHSKTQLVTKKSASKFEGRRDIAIIFAAAVLGAMLLTYLGANMGSGSISVDKDSIRRVSLVAAIAVLVPAFLLWFLDLFQQAGANKEFPGHRTIAKITTRLRRGSK